MSTLEEISGNSEGSRDRLVTSGSVMPSLSSSEASAPEVPPVHRLVGPQRRPAARRVGSVAARGTLLVVWLVLAGIFALLEPTTFLTHGTFSSIFGSQQPLVFLALAVTLSFSVGEFDLSVSGTMGLSSVLVAQLTVVNHWNVWLAAIVALAAAAVVGFVNSILIVGLGIDAIIITLGMTSLLAGVALGITKSTAIVGMSAGFSDLANHNLLGLPLSFYYGLTLAVLLAYMMFATPLGRHMSFVGANREVARLAGIKVTRIRVGAYVGGALIAGLGGVILAASVRGADATSSPSYLLPAFAAAVLSTTVLVPGRFNPLGAVIAIYFLVTGVVGLQLYGYTGWVTQVFFGGSLMVAVALSRVVRGSSVSSRGSAG